MSAERAALVALDWGTSSLRGARLDAAGRVLEQRSTPHGILQVAPGGFAAVCAAAFGDWMDDGAVLCLVCGMAGSRQGWLEAPYCPCPAGFAELAERLAWVSPGRIAIVPGLRCERDGVPDVLRGEETQIIGALQLTGRLDGLFVLPGTHSKWATVQNGRVTAFRTHMTGEFYALLSRHSLLAQSVAPDAPFDGAAFDAGVGRATAGAGLLHTAFGTRTLSLFGRMEAPALASYLSGLVIGEELRAEAAAAGSHAVLVGATALTGRYARALAAVQCSSQCLGDEAAWAGLHALARSVHD